jgi:4'-phosphopantetheinyl transferase
VDRTQIVVACVELDLTDPAENATVVSEDERQRAARYRHAIDRRRFLARRAQTRLILAEMLDRPAHKIVFSLGAYGKPSVEGSEIRFSTSHSNGLWLIAVGADRELGCDIEHRNPDRDLAMLASMAMADSEMRWFSGVREDLKLDVFYDRWTLKEAYLKALGIGLTMPMTDFAITTDPFQIVTHAGDGGDWHAQSLRPRPDYQAAVVAQGRDWCTRKRDPSAWQKAAASTTKIFAHGQTSDPY